MTLPRYKQPLEDGHTCCLYEGDTLVFSSNGTWLHPLFEAERFLQDYKGDRKDLAIHDKAAGKAAAILMARLGIEKAHIDLISALAITVFGEKGIEVSWDRQVERLSCKTEQLLEPMQDENAMYRLLRQRADLVGGIQVDVDKASFSYGGKQVFKNLSFLVPAGGRLIVRGGNGTGKTTLLKLLMGKLDVTEGTIRIGEKTPSQLPMRTIGYIRQQQIGQQFPVSVKEVVAMAVDTKKDKTHREWEIDTALRRTGMADFAKRNYFTLSGGEQQKVSLARCLCQQAKLLLFDEPTSFLDETGRKTLVDILQSLTLSEMPTIIIVTHDSRFCKDLGWESLYLQEENGHV